MIDVQQQINSVERAVGMRTFRAGEMRTVTVSQTYRTSIEDLWDACTNAERIPRWFLPVTGDLRLGGSYQLEGNAHGTIEECEPPRRFLAGWDFQEQHSWIELHLEPLDVDRTRFVLDHIVEAENDHWLQFGPGAVGIGWDLALTGLLTHLSTGQPVDSDAALAWLASAEGRGFIFSAGRSWLEADLAGGTDPDQAKAAAERTIAAYTGD